MLSTDSDLKSSGEKPTCTYCEETGERNRVGGSGDWATGTKGWTSGLGSGDESEPEPASEWTL